MIDQVTLNRIDLLHPIIKEEVKDLYLNQVVPALTSDVYCRFAYTLRTFAEQDDLYAQGRTKLFDNAGNKLGKITNASAGESFHNFGLSFDIVLINGNSASWDTSIDFDGDGITDWMEIVNIFKDNGYAWGGEFVSFPDKPHIQKVFGYTWQDLLAKYNQKDFISGTTYVNI